MPSGGVATFAVPGFGAQNITEELANRGVVISSGQMPGDLVHVDMTGVATTILAAGPMFVDLDVDGEGNYLGAKFEISAAKADPDLPATMMAVMMGPSSRTMARLTREAT